MLKPASTAPLTPLALAGILGEAGLPPGVLNVVTGTGETVGEALVREPRVRKISFTGSLATGRRITASRPTASSGSRSSSAARTR